MENARLSKFAPTRFPFHVLKFQVSSLNLTQKQIRNLSTWGDIRLWANHYGRSAMFNSGEPMLNKMRYCWTLLEDVACARSTSRCD
jgi:hypothetical protein